MFSPLDVLVGNQKVGQEDADAIALPVLIHFDMAHRGKADTNCVNYLTQHILIAITIGSKSGNKAFHGMATDAYNALYRACGRPGELVSLTTGEYQAMRRMFAAYVRILPTATVKLLNFACGNAKRILDGLDKQAA